MNIKSFISEIKTRYGKSGNKLPVKPEAVYMNAQLAVEFAGEQFAAQLYGRIYKQKTDSDKWAVLLHPNQLNGHIIADKIGYIYYELGYNILAPDLRGFGKSSGHVALGCLESMDVYDWLCKLNEDYNTKHIVVHGLSLGGTTVNFLSGIDKFMEKGPVQVHPLSSLTELHVVALIADSSYIDMLQFASQKYLVSHGTGLTKETFHYYSNAANSLPYATPAMMIIHGSKDTIVSPNNADKIAACLKTPPRYWKVDGQNHVFVLMGRQTAKYRQEVQEFLMGIMPKH
ncbi:MAG: alpha/beta hydrolase [Lachnospiraceae bacterium]